jgi:oligoendopeptidase F
MKKQTFRDRQTDILGACLDDIAICIFRQHALTRFERRLYEKSADHILSESELNDLWWREHHILFGEAVEMAPVYRWGWTHIPHFIHHPFYCYSYVFGNLLSLYLMRRYHEDRDFTLDVIIYMLRAGGSKDPLDLLSEGGIDPGEDTFYEVAFGYLGEMIDSFEAAILNKRNAIDSSST